MAIIKANIRVVRAAPIYVEPLRPAKLQESWTSEEPAQVDRAESGVSLLAIKLFAPVNIGKARLKPTGPERRADLR